MEVKIQYWDVASKTHKDANCFDDVCTYSEKLQKYTRKTLRISVLDGNRPLLAFKAQPSYDQCCGLREIGSIEIFTTDANAVRSALVEAVEKHPLFDNAGALTYTRYKNPEYELQDSRLVSFIEEWPNASAGEWFYNPNSGNLVQQWTLPINQHRQHKSEDDDE